MYTDLLRKNLKIIYANYLFVDLLKNNLKKFIQTSFSKQKNE